MTQEQIFPSPIMTQEQIFPSPETLSEKPKKHTSIAFYIAQLSFRVLVPLFTLAATIMTLKSDQTIEMPFGSFGARYSYSSGIRYKVMADIVVGVFCLLSLMFVYFFTQPKWNVNNYFYIFLHDLVLLLLITSGCTAGTSIGMVALNGESEIGWGAICPIVPKFCLKVTLGIVFSYMALSSMFILTIMAAYKLRS